MHLLRILIGILLSGTLFMLALPPADQGYLGWIAMAPLLWSVHNTRFIYGFAAGLLTCLFSAFLASNGVFLSKSIPDGSPQWIYTGFVLFGWITGVVAGAAAEMKNHTVRGTLGLAALAVAMELVTMIILPAHLALTQYRVGPVLTLSSFGGIWFVSFLLWLTNAALASSLTEKAPKQILFAGSVTAAMLLACYGLRSIPNAGKAEAGIYLALVQTETTDLKRLTELNARATPLVDVAVWPELAGVDAVYGGNTSELLKVAKTQGQPAFITSFKDNHKPKPHNTAAIFSIAGESKRYHKRKPFSGEKMIHEAGVDPTVVDHRGLKLGLNICFDSCYPAVMRETVLEGAEAVLLPTQDPRSSNGVIQAIHAAYTPFRAAELGVPIARTDMSAYSMLVDSRGDIVLEAGCGTEEVVSASLPLRPHGTLYKSLGDWFLYVCAALLLWSAWGLRRDRLTKFGGQAPE